MRLALDHITAVDTTPAELARVARAAGCDGMCLFLHPMDVLPLMPRFELLADKAARRDLKRAMDDLGVALDVAYPFTLAGRTDIAAFVPAMECAAELEAGLLNVLLYDRDPARRVDTFGRFCEMAAGFGHKVGVEFYPPSQVPSLHTALELVRAIDRPGMVGINADLLHLMRSGGTIAELAAAAAEGAILYGQVADGPALAPESLDREASSERLLCGEGAFDIAGFVRALPPGCGISIEIPRNHAVGPEDAEMRARRAVEGLRRVLRDG
jgi:sugar phosphate isomerase/epimerase